MLMTKPAVYIKEITFSDRTILKFDPGDIVLIVGPNNAGKSLTLRSIYSCLETGKSSPALQSVIFQFDGSAEDVLVWLPTVSMYEDGRFSLNRSSSTNISSDNVHTRWQKHTLGPLTPLFCRQLSADGRLAATKPILRIPITEVPTFPLHYLLVDTNLELKLSNEFREAFGHDLIINHGAGQEIVLHIGQRPNSDKDRDRVSQEYVKELELLPRLDQEGDGRRSYAGILIETAIPPATIHLIDEPEAFLHPPQARLIGRVLAQDHLSNHQAFIATHSGDVLRGMLDANNPQLRIIRLQRHGTMNEACELTTADIGQYWGDPLLRYSNILDGIFHEKVVICESDSDNRFYAAVLDAVCDLKGAGYRRPDVMFANCGGKDWLPSAVRALRQLGVPVAAVADFDVLNDEQPLRGIVEALGVLWDEVEDKWRRVKNAVEQKKPELGSEEIKEKITKLLTAVKDPIFPQRTRKEIERELRRSTPWSTAKSTGLSFVPSGDPTQAVNALFERLAVAGLFIVPVGEVEMWVKDVGGHGPKWVNQVLVEKDLRDGDLRNAREFVEKLIGNTLQCNPS
jgi:hypothetical protein